MSLTDRTDRLEEIANYFQRMNMVHSMKKIQDLELALINGVASKPVSKAYEEFVKISFAESIRNDEHRRRCIYFMDGKIGVALRANIEEFQKINDDSMELSKQRSETRKALSKLNSLMIKTPDDIHGIFILFNTQYATVVDGLFDRDIKQCYIWLRLAEGHTLDYSVISRMKIADIYNYFHNKKQDLSIFEGWSRSIRNSISHQTFSFDEKTKLMTYEDKPSNWSNTFSIHDVFELGRKLINVDDMIMTLVQILRVRDYCFALDPFQ